MQMEANYYYCIAPHFCGQKLLWFKLIFMIHHHFMILELSSPALKSAEQKFSWWKSVILVYFTKTMKNYTTKFGATQYCNIRSTVFHIHKNFMTIRYNYSYLYTTQLTVFPTHWLIPALGENITIQYHESSTLQVTCFSTPSVLLYVYISCYYYYIGLCSYLSL